MKLIGMYTAAGAELAAQAQAEDTVLVITRAAAGSGCTAADQTVMAQEEQALTLHSKRLKGQSVTVPAGLTAAQAAEVYTLKEVGLYARIGSEAEVLYKLFRLDESLTVEPDTDLTVTFYLTETILQAGQVEVTISQQGLVTQEMCQQTAQAAADAVQAGLDGHLADGSAHSALFAQKAAASHTHPASQVTAGTLGGQVAAQSNTAYTTAQVRNIALSTADPSGGSNGQVWIKYTA